MIVYMVIAMCYYTYLSLITSKGVIKHVWLWNIIFRKVFQGPKFSLKTVVLWTKIFRNKISVTGSHALMVVSIASYVYCTMAIFKFNFYW